MEGEKKVIIKKSFVGIINLQNACFIITDTDSVNHIEYVIVLRHTKIGNLPYYRISWNGVDRGGFKLVTKENKKYYSGRVLFNGITFVFTCNVESINGFKLIQLKGGRKYTFKPNNRKFI